MLDAGTRLAAVFLPVGVPVIVGLVVAVLRRRSRPVVSGPAIAGLALQLVVVVATTFLVAADSLDALRLPRETLLPLSSTLGILVIVLQVLSWTLLLTALFRRLPAEVAGAQAAPATVPALAPDQDRTPTGRHALLDDRGAQVVAEEGATFPPVAGAATTGAALETTGATGSSAASGSRTDSGLPSRPRSGTGRQGHDVSGQDFAEPGHPFPGRADTGGADAGDADTGRAGSGPLVEEPAVTDTFATEPDQAATPAVEDDPSRLPVADAEPGEDEPPTSETTVLATSSAEPDAADPTSEVSTEATTKATTDDEGVAGPDATAEPPDENPARDEPADEEPVDHDEPAGEEPVDEEPVDEEHTDQAAPDEDPVDDEENTDQAPGDGAQSDEAPEPVAANGTSAPTSTAKTEDTTEDTAASAEPATARGGHPWFDPDGEAEREAGEQTGPPQASSTGTR